MATNAQKASDNYEAYSYARDHGHLDYLQKAKVCDAFFEGNQWEHKVRAKLERLGKPVITINKILSTIAAIWGEQMSHRADIAFHQAKNGDAETAQVLDKLWLHVTNQNNYDWVESQMAAEGFIRSRGFVDLRVAFDDHMEGEVKVRLLNSKNVLIDPDASEYDPDEWQQVFVTKWLTRNDLDRVYGQGAAKELESLAGAAYHHRYDTADWLPDTFGGRSLVGGFDSYRSDNAQRRIYRVIERQYKEARWVEHFVNLDTGDMRVVPDTWSRNRIAYVLENYGPLAVVRKKIDQIRWTASTDILTLHDEISPYRHFTPIPFFPFFMHGMTIGIVENLISPQELLNKSVSQELHVINTTANSGWKLKNGSLQNMTVEELEERGAEDGLTLVLNQTADAEKITPNSIPTGLDRVSFKADEALKEVSMVSDSMRGFDRADVAARAIQAKQARGTVSLAPALNNLDYTRRLVARNTLDLLQSFYTEPRVIQMAGRDLAAEQEPIVINQQTPEGTVIHDLTIGEYSIVLSTVPARESFQQTQFQEAIEMRKVGIAVPDDVIVEHSHLQRKMEVAKRIKELNGGVEPSEEEQQMQQQLQALEMRVKQAEVAEREADAQLKQANAQLSMARAQREASGEGGEKQADPRIAQLEQVKLQAEIQYKQRELELKQRELELKERVAMAELRLKSMDSAQRELLENKKLEASKEKAQQKPSPKPKAPEKTNG